ncbi:hypothetical protein Tcan_10255 [Toxocara canis]|uniref:Uncharacterized protein n=1 Tax=Toxocara canis TaxID=6265 RepID=A0A0B2UN05_TOXCA|nr:hypothetical protein Tcan_10255 [Toxocara canis]
MDDDIVDLFVVIIVVAFGLLGLVYLTYRAYADHLRSYICCCHSSKSCEEGVHRSPTVSHLRVAKAKSLDPSKLGSSSTAHSAVAHSVQR